MVQRWDSNHDAVADRKAVLTTGQVARICHVAPRTVSKWFDTGKLRGYRIPGSRDRRIPLPQLIAFMRAHGIPLDGLDGGICRVLLIDSQAPDGAAEALNTTGRYDVRVAANEFQAGMLAEQLSPHAIVVNVGQSSRAASEMCRSIRENASLMGAKLIGATDGPIADELASLGFDGILRRPYSAADLARAVEQATDLVA